VTSQEAGVAASKEIEAPKGSRAGQPDEYRSSDPHVHGAAHPIFPNHFAFAPVPGAEPAFMQIAFGRVSNPLRPRAVKAFDEFFFSRAKEFTLNEHRKTALRRWPRSTPLAQPRHNRCTGRIRGRRRRPTP
jgi:hypothetical protein